YEKWGNFKPDPEAVRYVASHWPTKIIFTGGGAFADLMKTGKTPFQYELTSNPVSRAYDIYLKDWRDWHHSADLIAVYVAVRGWEEFFVLTSVGYNHIFEDGTLMWRLQPDDPRHSYINDLKEGVEAETIAKVFDDLMVQSIRAKRLSDTLDRMRDMRIKGWLIVVIIFYTPLVSLAQSPIKVILDTDIDSDVDDVGALAMLHTLADHQVVDLLGVIVTSDDRQDRK